MNDLLVVGWREWVGLPDLGITQIKAKVDTGARTSAIHAFNLRPFFEDGVQRIEFHVNPHQRDTDTVFVCSADVIDQRVVMDSGGNKEDRWVIGSHLTVGGFSWPIELTLTARDDMRFRMLLGRHALKKRALVDPTASYLLGKKIGKTKSP
jgi:hypothetical protein